MSSETSKPPSTIAAIIYNVINTRIIMAGAFRVQKKASEAIYRAELGFFVLEQCDWVSLEIWAAFYG